MPNAQHCERNEVTRMTRGRESEACIVVMVTSLADAVGVAVDGGMEGDQGDGRRSRRRVREYELKRNVRTVPRRVPTDHSLHVSYQPISERFDF